MYLESNFHITPDANKEKRRTETSQTTLVSKFDINKTPRYYLNYQGTNKRDSRKEFSYDINKTRKSTFI